MTLGFPLTTLAGLLMMSVFVLGGKHTLSKTAHRRLSQNSSLTVDDLQGRHRQKRKCNKDELYLIATKTGSSASAGTDDDVIISLEGAECRTAYTFLDNPGKKDFLRNHTDYFKKWIGYVGEMKSIMIRRYKISYWIFSEDGDKWYLEYIKIYGLTSQKKWMATFNRWIDTYTDFYEASVMPIK